VQITVESRFITGESLPEELKRVAPAAQTAAEPLQPIFLTDAQAQALLASLQRSKDSTTLTAPRITLFNGQRAFVTVATETAYVAGFTPKGGDLFEPVTRTINSGVVLDCQATVSADHRYVTLNLRPHLSRLKSFETRRWDGAPPDRDDLIIQVPVQDKITNSMTVSVPDGGWLVLPPGADSTFERNQNPLMLVRPNIILQRELDPTTMPTL
jgi:hypothetical protein